MSIPLETYFHIPSLSIITRRMLELASLILGLVNGAMLLRQYARDRPKLKVSLEDAEHLEWSSWFLLPPGTFEGKPTRNYGFLLYLDISNAGLRKVQLQSWKLATRNGLLQTYRMPALNLPAIEIELGPVIKQIPVLGQMTHVFHGNTVIDSGCSISGLTFFNLQVYGSSHFDPRMKAKAKYEEPYSGPSLCYGLLREKMEKSSLSSRKIAR